MEYKEKVIFLDTKPNQPSKFRTKKSIQINDSLHGTDTIDSQIKVKTMTLKSSLCDYSYAYILVKGTITVQNMAAATGADANNTNKKVSFKNYAPFTDWISEINNTPVVLKTCSNANV